MRAPLPAAHRARECAPVAPLRVAQGRTPPAPARAWGCVCRCTCPRCVSPNTSVRFRCARDSPPLPLPGGARPAAAAAAPRARAVAAGAAARGARAAHVPSEHRLGRYGALTLVTTQHHNRFPEQNAQRCSFVLARSLAHTSRALVRVHRPTRRWRRCGARSSSGCCACAWRWRTSWACASSARRAPRPRAARPRRAPRTRRQRARSRCAHTPHAQELQPQALWQCR
jgi:hypothetical protein